MAEQNAVSVFRPEVADSLFNRRPQLLRFKLLERGFPRGDDGESRCLFLVGGGGIRRSFDAYRLQVALSQVIDRDIIRDLEEPARELEVGAVPVDVVQDLYEGFLGQIFGELAIPDHAEDERKHRPLVPGQQLAIGRLPPFFRQRDNGLVR